MPQLPSLGDIPQEQFDRIVAAFPGDTATEKTAAYRSWLTNRLIERVEQAELKRLEREADAARVLAIGNVRASLPPRLEEPPLP